MVHEPSGVVFGDAAAMLREADNLDAVANSMAAIYSRRSGQSDEQYLQIMQTELWMDAATAMDYGFCDSIAEVA